MNYHITDIDTTEIILSNIVPECYQCIQGCTNTDSAIVKCSISNQKYRRGQIVFEKNKLHLCTNHEIESTRLFKDKQKIFCEFLSLLSSFRNNIVNEQNKKVHRLKHNLSTYNGQSLQEIYDFISQEKLAKSEKKQVEILEQTIKENPALAAQTMLHLLKNIHLSKTEFAVFNMLDNISPKLDIQPHSIHKVLLLILNPFWLSFLKKHVELNIQKNEDKVKVDYTSMTAALCHIIENISKYIAPETQLSISFAKINNSTLLLKFDMLSLKIDNDEKDLIFQENYSGIHAKKAELAGSGLGLYIVKRLLELNKAEIRFLSNVDNGESAYSYKGNKYEKNVIEITLRI